MSINSSTDIGNLALDLLHAGTVLDIENPSNPTEEILNRWYDQTRKKCLREHSWNFAIKRQVLAASATDPAFGYAKQFPLPADFLRLLYISTDLATDRETILPSSAYQVENNAILITNTYGNSTSLNLVYVSDFQTVSQMDPLFIDYLAHELAIAVAYKVTENNTNVQRIEALAEKRGAIARAIDGQERPATRIQRSKAINARRRGSQRDAHRIIF